MKTNHFKIQIKSFRRKHLLDSNRLSHKVIHTDNPNKSLGTVQVKTMMTQRVKALDIHNLN